jgi:hypothetical protein
MMGGGHIAGRLVDGEASGDEAALTGLAAPEGLEKSTAPRVRFFAVCHGDGNLAWPRQAWWEQLKKSQRKRRENPPGPLGLVELVKHPRRGVQLRAIHRVLLHGRRRFLRGRGGFWEALHGGESNGGHMR